MYSGCEVASNCANLMPPTFLRLPSTSYVAKYECNVCMKRNRYRFVLMRYGFIDAVLKDHDLCEEFLRYLGCAFKFLLKLLHLHCTPTSTFYFIESAETI